MMASIHVTIIGYCRVHNRFRIDGLPCPDCGRSRMEEEKVGDLTGKMTGFGTGATRSSADGKPDYRGFLSPQAQEMFGRYMMRHQTQADGKRRASDNWKKGMPVKRYAESLYRHAQTLHKHLDRIFANDKLPRVGTPEWTQLEEEVCGVFFNIQGLMHELERSVEAAGAREHGAGDPP